MYPVYWYDFGEKEKVEKGPVGMISSLHDESHELYWIFVHLMIGIPW